MGNLRKPIFYLVIFLPILGIFSAYLKVTKAGAATLFLEASMITYGVFVALCIIDIYKSKALNLSEKWMYAIGVIFLGFIGGILYLSRPEKQQFHNRYRILDEK